MQDTLDAWIACQAAWQYLEPIFSSPDIMAQMPEAGEKFGMVDASWRDIMDAAAVDPSALSAGKSRERLDTLNEANQLLDEIQKSALHDILLRSMVSTGCQPGAVTWKLLTCRFTSF